MHHRSLMILTLFLGACGQSDAPPPAAPAAVTETATAAPVVAPQPTVPVAPDAVAPVTAEHRVTGTAPEGITPDEAASSVAEGPVATAGTTAASSPAPGTTATTAPYHVVDGKIDQNTVEGWKTYRGIGTCATCHGPVGQGGVGPALIVSLQEKITRDLFVDVVTNGRSGTMMKPFAGNQIVMDNLDNIYAYLKARADGVLGPENLLKYPLGKIE